MSAAVLPCPRCGSARVQRSHRRTAMDHVLYTLGAEIRRCRECRFRHAMFQRRSLALSDPRWAGGSWKTLAFVTSGFLFCLLFVLWMIRRFTELSG